MIEHAKQLVALSCLLLDEEKFADYLALFAEGSRYSIRAYSPDLRKDLSLLDLERAELETLLKNLRKHVRLPGRFLRLAAPTLEHSNGGEIVSLTTTVLVTHTDLEGISRVFAAGRYVDKIEVKNGRALIREREVRVDTRQFGTGSHIPL
jgi:3-phenylpropionate/cinnamic acid dioxygenase small subunit